MKFSFRDKRAFSFIELMLVAVIIGALAALAVPRMRTAFDKYELESFVRSVYNRAIYMQANAVAKGKTHCLRVDPQSGAIIFFYKDADEQKEVAGMSGRPLRPPVATDIVTENDAICFYPDSSTDEGRIDLSRKNYNASVVFQGDNGAIQVE